MSSGGKKRGADDWKKDASLRSDYNKKASQSGGAWLPAEGIKVRHFDRRAATLRQQASARGGQNGHEAEFWLALPLTFSFLAGAPSFYPFNAL